ncbi:GlxA family transcriptional regulator [Rhodovastum atsumiense]|uniref:GlxA family transcriptional regulator n=1 Tax=Rhodovastum atsumiense TaxID=504468 RepID=A0A5M6IJK4_9PROT|nr:GlxA family transcriptional regulator [Rhodovastum atsumiense]KAA5608352.1 GlxA family transcriptional regulator [Rhodovastum atsumiense]CAH2602334.1 GlxA family transcriptional regulator [Rhodovastum atsumiense]
MPQVGFVIFPDFQVAALSAQAAFEFANLVAREPFYTLVLTSIPGGMVRSSLGFQVETQALATHPSFDTLMITGGNLPNDRLTAADLAVIRRHSAEARRTAGICTGAFVLAQAGLLRGRRATTHWLFGRQMQLRFPEVEVEEDRIFINEGPIWTSAGMTAGLDLAVAMVEKDLGAEVARSVARKLVMHHRRAGGQSQHSELLELAASSDRIQKALIYAKENLGQALTVERLAEVASLSPRQFSRAFRAETGQTPARAIEQLRLEAARILLEDSRHPLDVVARETGFLDPRRMRESFLRVYGQPPQVMRRAARERSAA